MSPSAWDGIEHRDVGASEIVGSILMVAITVAVAAGMVTVVYGAIAGDEPPRRASLSASIHENDGGWGTGDETITVTHKGGHSLHVDELAIVIEIAGQETRFSQDGDLPLDHAGQHAFSASDRTFAIGERWTSSDVEIPTRASLTVRVLDTQASTTLWSASFQAGAVTSSFVLTPLGMQTGTVSNDAAARSATDDEASATLTEEQNGTTSSQTDEYTSASTGSATTQNPSNAERSPDDSYARLDANGEFVETTNASSSVGSITKVELALEGKHNGAKDSGDTDGVRLSHDQGTSSQRFPLSTSDAKHFVDVTGDKASWSWSDVETLTIRATCECHDTGSDAKEFSIDALWVRVTATTEKYELETQPWSFDPLGSGDRHTLEIRYRTTTAEDFEVQVWDGSTWRTLSNGLSRTAFVTLTASLTDDEVDAGPEIRIVDAGETESAPGSLDVDFARVVSS